MKRPKRVHEFFFLQSMEEIRNYLNKNYPISFPDNYDLIDRIHIKYPLLNKIQIAVIVKNVFQSIRELLVCGEILNFNKLFFDTKLHFFPYRKNNAVIPAVKVKISTPPYLKRNQDGK